MIPTFLSDRGRDARLGVIREAHRCFERAGDDERDLFTTVCEALCQPGAYLHARLSEKRAGGTVRQVGFAGTAPEIAVDSFPGWEMQTGGALPDPVFIPIQTGRAVALPVPVGGEPGMALLVAASSKKAFDSAETGDLSILASRVGAAIATRRSTERFDSLKKKYDALVVDIEGERDYSTRLLDLVPLPILQIGPEGEIRLFNKRCESLTGYRASEALNRRMPDLLIPEPLRSDFRRLLVELFIGRRSGSFPFPLLIRSGDSIPINWNISPIREGGSGKIASILACGETTNAS